MNDGQADWVLRNRASRHAAESLGAVLEREMRRAPMKVPAWRSRIAGAVAELADSVFLQHAWLVGFRAGVATFGVDEAGLVGALRMRWHRVLVDHLNARLPDLGIIDVRFSVAAAPAPPSPRVSPEDVERWAEQGYRDGAGFAARGESTGRAIEVS